MTELYILTDEIYRQFLPSVLLETYFYQTQRSSRHVWGSLLEAVSPDGWIILNGIIFRD